MDGHYELCIEEYLKPPGSASRLGYPCTQEGPTTSRGGTSSECGNRHGLRGSGLRRRSEGASTAPNLLPVLITAPGNALRAPSQYTVFCK